MIGLQLRSGDRVALLHLIQVPVGAEYRSPLLVIFIVVFVPDLDAPPPVRLLQAGHLEGIVFARFRDGGRVDNAGIDALFRRRNPDTDTLAFADRFLAFLIKVMRCQIDPEVPVIQIHLVREKLPVIPAAFIRLVLLIPVAESQEADEVRILRAAADDETLVFHKAFRLAHGQEGIVSEERRPALRLRHCESEISAGRFLARRIGFHRQDVMARFQLHRRETARAGGRLLLIAAHIFVPDADIDVLRALAGIGDFYLEKISPLYGRSRQGGARLPHLPVDDALHHHDVAEPGIPRQLPGISLEFAVIRLRVPGDRLSLIHLAREESLSPLLPFFPFAPVAQHLQIISIEEPQRRGVLRDGNADFQLLPRRRLNGALFPPVDGEGQILILASLADDLLDDRRAIIADRKGAHLYPIIAPGHKALPALSVRSRGNDDRHRRQLLPIAEP